MLVMDWLERMLTGQMRNIVDDFMEQDSKEVSVSFNGLIVSSFLLAGLGVLCILNVITGKRLFLICCIILTTVFVLGTVITILAVYLRAKKKTQNTIVSKLLDPVILPTVICMIQVLVTNRKTVGLVYQNLHTPQSTVILILTLIMILCYMLAMAFCHFSNIYCLIAFVFEKNDLKLIQAKIDAVQEKDAKREGALRQIAEYVDNKAGQVNFFRKCGLFFSFFYAHIKAYSQERYYAVSYLSLSYCPL